MKHVRVWLRIYPGLHCPRVMRHCVIDPCKSQRSAPNLSAHCRLDQISAEEVPARVQHRPEAAAAATRMSAETRTHHRHHRRRLLEMTVGRVAGDFPSLSLPFLSHFPSPFLHTLTHPYLFPPSHSPVPLPFPAPCLFPFLFSTRTP